MGVSDAVKIMGTPQDEKTAKEKIMGFLQTESNSNDEINKRRITSTISTTSTKKLGRSITDIQTAKE
jgi:hypothetical protein